MNGTVSFAAERLCREAYEYEGFRIPLLTPDRHYLVSRRGCYDIYNPTTNGKWRYENYRDFSIAVTRILEIQWPSVEIGMIIWK